MNAYEASVTAAPTTAFAGIAVPSRPAATPAATIPVIQAERGDLPVTEVPICSVGKGEQRPEGVLRVAQLLHGGAEEAHNPSRADVIDPAPPKDRRAPGVGYGMVEVRVDGGADRASGDGDGQVNLLGHRVVRSGRHREAVEQRPPG
ncbi:hypothetical protein GCM10010216_21690 [Streptomyces flaveolus]|nr:hypothetical protein GCM10010216_21690 [Streptomyces flaveolus]